MDFSFYGFLGHSHSHELSFRTCHFYVLWMCGSKTLMSLAQQWHIFSSFHFLGGVENHKNHHIIVIMLSTIVIVCSATSLALSYCRFFQIFDKTHMHARTYTSHWNFSMLLLEPMSIKVLSSTSVI